MEMKFNELQTPITTEYLDGLHPDIRAELIEILDQILLVQRMVSPSRLRAKDLERDNKGRILVDLENPHILEDTDYFRQAALYYQKHKVYTHLYPNKHPQSAYMQFWKEEIRRCKEGYVRESDGEWIPGYFYFYLNYSPILLTKIVDGEKSQSSSVRAERIYDFPKFWDGDYLYFHYIEQGERDGEYGNVLKTRGRGFSFKGGAMYARNYYMYKQSKSFAMASEKEYLIKDGILSKTWEVLSWVDDHTPWRRARQKYDREMHKKASYIDPKKKIEKGFGSEIIGVTLQANPQKARGKRGKLIGWEESGIFPGLSTAWGIARMSLEDGRRTFGYMVAFGTGGTEGADFSSALAFFYEPDGFKIKSLRNIYDKVRGVGRCSFFFPEYLNRADCYDENGNSDVIKALLELLHDRQRVREGTTDPHVLTQEKADRPITPQEAVMRKDGSLFPISDINDHLAHILPNLQKFISPHYVGRLALDPTGEVRWVGDPNAVVVREFPIKDNLNKEGAIEIYELPNKYKPIGRYIAGIDPVDDDHSTTNSLTSIFVFDTFTDRIVAEYTGRPHKANDFYEIALRLLIFYNAMANYENDKKGLFTYFSQRNKLHYLCDNPKILKDMDMVKGQNYGNKAKGTNSGKRINQWGRRLQADWMITPISSEDDKDKIKLNLHTIRSVAYLKECATWNEDGNFDRVSAMGMLMILREDLRIYSDSLKDEKPEDIRTVSDDFLDMIKQDQAYKFGHRPQKTALF